MYTRGRGGGRVMLLFLPCHIVVGVRSTTLAKRFASLRVVGRWLHLGLLSCRHRLRGLSCVPCICSGVQERQSTARVYLRSYLLPPLSSMSFPHLRLFLLLNSHFTSWNCVCPAYACFVASRRAVVDRIAAHFCVAGGTCRASAARPRLTMSSRPSRVALGSVAWQVRKRRYFSRFFHDCDGSNSSLR